mgnify:CR=1 FL=1
MIAGYWLALVPLFCVAFRGLLLWGTKGEYLIWGNSEGNIWTEGWERTETKVQKSRQVGLKKEISSNIWLLRNKRLCLLRNKRLVWAASIVKRI